MAIAPTQQPEQQGGILDAFLKPNVQGQGLGTLGQNPLFNIGMNVLAANYGGGNPFAAALQGLGTSVDAQTAAKEQAYKATQRELAEKDRKRREQLGQDVSGIISEQLATGHPGLQDMPGADMTPEQRALGRAYQEMAALDPAQALKGWQSYQVSQQQNQATQAATRSKSPFIDENNNVWLFDSKAPGGKVQMYNEDGSPMKGPAKLRTMQIGGPNGPIIQVDERQANKMIELYDAKAIATDVADAADVKKQRDAYRDLPGIESSFARPNSAWNKVSMALSDEYADMREKSSGLSVIAFQAQAMIPGSKEADYKMLVDQIMSGAFLEAAKDLSKSGATLGQITEVEGVKMEQAAANLRTARTMGELDRKLNEYRDSVKGFLQAARREAGVDVDAPYIEGLSVDFRSPEKLEEADKATQEKLKTWAGKYGPRSRERRQ